jgi:hypothetical protein
MPNPGHPTIGPRATGDLERRVQGAVRRTPELELKVDGVFLAADRNPRHQFSEGCIPVTRWCCRALTWQALPDGGPIPLLAEGSTGDVVRHLHTVLTDGPGESRTPHPVSTATPAPRTRACVQAFQRWGVSADGTLGDQTWAVSRQASPSTLESVVGLSFVIC